MTVRVLGEVSILAASGEHVRVSQQKREILAAIVAATGQLVSREALCRAIWHDDSPTVHHRLKSQVAQLRTLLPPGLGIAHAGSGYRLTGGHELVDAIRFESLLRRIDGVEPTSDAYAQALGLWTGEVPFGGIDNELVQEAGWRLLAMRDRAIGSLAEALYISGDHIQTIDYIEPIFVADPTRGDATRLLALALAGVGRDVEALRIIGRHRAAVAVVGTATGRDIEAVEVRILRQDYPTSRVMPSAVHTAPSGGGYIDRRDIHDELITGLARRSVLLVGEAGAGKTTTSRQLVTRLSQEFGTAAAVVAAPASPTRSMETIYRLVSEVGRVAPDILQRVELDAGVFDAWGKLSGERSDLGPFSRDEFLGALVELLSAVAGEPIFMVIEDLHHIDRNSMDVIRGVLAQGPAHHLLFTSRSEIPELADLVETLPMRPMSRNDVETLVGVSMSTPVPAATVDDLCRRSGGNPLYLSLLIEALSLGEDAEEQPTSLRHAVLQRCELLSKSARQTLDVAALLGPTFDPLLLSLAAPAAQAGLSEATGEALVQQDGANFRFVHELVAEVLVAAVPAGRKVDIHDQLCALSIAHGASPQDTARHALGAASIDPRRAGLACLAVAAEQAEVFAWTEVIEWTTKGLEMIAAGANSVDLVVRSDLHLMRGSALRRTLQPGSAADLIAASRAAFEAGDGERLVVAVTELCLHGASSVAGSVDKTAEELFDLAIEARASRSAHVRLGASAATLFSSSDRWSVGRRLFRDALDESIHVGDSRLRRDVLLNSHIGLGHPDDLAERSDAAIELATFDDSEARWEAAFVRFAVALVQADLTELRRTTARIEELSSAVAQRDRMTGLLQLQTVMAMLAGDLGRADALATQAIQRATATSASWAAGMQTMLFFPLRDAQGRSAELLPIATRLRSYSPGFPSWLSVEACVRAASGDIEGARSLVDQLFVGDFALVEDLSWTAAVSLAARAVHIVGHRPSAKLLYERLSPYSGQMSWNGLSTHGPIDAALALLADTIGDLIARVKHLRIADELLDDLKAPHMLWPEANALR